MYICFLLDKKYLSYIEPITINLDIKYFIIYIEDIEKEKSKLLKSKLIVTIHSFHKKVLDFLQEVNGKVKTLTIQDGIIEFKSSNHRFQGNYRFRPLYSDFIACFGEQSKRILLAYGVQEKQIIITGNPRFDNIKSYNSQGKYLLITMANRPGYGLKNTIKYYKLMESLLYWLEENEVLFKLRLSRGVSKIGQESIYKIFDNPSDILKKYYDHMPSKESLYEDLSKSYAVITTPSTVSLEAMLFNIPVVHLISDSVPINLQTIYNIYRKEDFSQIINELKNPNSFKMLNQKMILEDNISYTNNSTVKVIEIIKDLI